MRRDIKIFAAKCAVLLAVPAVMYSFSFGPPPAHTGAAGEANCTACHVGTAVNGGSGQIAIELSSGALTYTPGTQQTITVRLSGDSTARYGFQLAAKLAGGGQAGTLAPATGESGIQVLCADGSTKGASGCPASAPVEYIEHSNPRTTPSFQIQWTPPASDQGPVTISVAVNAANGNFSNLGDRIYTRSVTVTPAGASNAPQINAGGVVSAAAVGSQNIAPGSHVSIFGTNLAPATAGDWGGLIGADGRLPTAIQGVSVTVDGKPAAISFIGPQQVNILVPADAGVGSGIAVAITTPQGTSQQTVTTAAAVPGFFKFGATNFAAATHANNNPIGPAGEFGNPNTAPARPGEVIQLWGSGFGATNPPAPTDRVVVPNPGFPEMTDRSQLRVQIGGQDAPVQFAGVTVAGVWQINVQVPAGLTAGRYPVVATLAGQSTPASGIELQIQ